MFFSISDCLAPIIIVDLELGRANAVAPVAVSSRAVAVSPGLVAILVFVSDNPNVIMSLTLLTVFAIVLCFTHL